jgi:tetratricopeptide (TPR) repeat protein
MDVDPNIAEVSLTFLPGERGQLLSPSIATEILVVNRIPSAPHQQVKDSYAKKLLAYKDIIEVDYTANYIENDADVLVLTDKSGIAFVHYLIEPRKLTFEQLGRRFKTNLEINGKIADLGGTTIYQFDRSIPIEFDQDRFDNIRSKLFSFQDVFPLVEGRYKLNILLKNIVSKEFTSVERDIIVPGPSALQFSPLLLANRIVTGSDYKGKTKAFLVGDLQLVPSPRNDFTSQDKLFLYFQVLGMSPELQAGGILEYTILREEEKVLSRSRNIRDLPDKTNFFEEFSLAELSSGYYKIKVSLFDQNSKELLFEQADFFISHLASLPRPWVLSLPMPPAEDSLFTNIRGNQWENKKDLARAKKLLAQAYRENPRSAKFALDYCRVLFKEKDYPQVKAVAAPFLNAPERNEFLAVLGQSSQALGEMEQAIAFYKEYLDHYGANLLILNAVGECYWKMGNAEEALLAFERSLQINPKQEEIQKIVKAIKEKK